MQNNDKNSKIQLWKGINMLYLPFVYTVFLFFATDIAVNHVCPCIIAFGKELTTKCGKHERLNRLSWWNLCPTNFVGQVFMFKNHIKANCSIGVSVFIFIMWNGRRILKYKG